MCTTIILTRMPLRLAERIRISDITCRYLTCGSAIYRREPQNKSLMNSSQFSQQLLLKCSFSTIPKNHGFDKNIIPGIRTTQQATVAANKSENFDNSGTEIASDKKLGLFARFKLMYKQYWYVLIPVHVITSIGWFGGFYYLSQSGVDIPALLETMNISETIINKLKESSMGHVAIAYLCYKIATPVRYMITLGGTTVSIKYLEQYGYIKPLPSKSRLIQMYEDKKADRAKRKQDKIDLEQKKHDDK